MRERAAGYQTKEREHFDALAENIGETWWGNRTPAAVLRMRRRASMVARALGTLHDPLVVELGCGTGTFSQYVLEVLPGLRLIGCDISPKAVELAARRCTLQPQVQFEVADATSLRYPDGTFDAVIGCSILHHLPVEQTLAECLRVLKPGGIIWFSEPNMMNPQTALERNVRSVGKLLQNTEDETAFFRWGVVKTLGQCGFRGVSVQPYDFLHPLVPRSLMAGVDRLARLVERIPLLREISGCLEISARKSTASG